MVEKRENSGDSMDKKAYTAKKRVPTTESVGTNRPITPKRTPDKTAPTGFGAFSLKGGIRFIQRKSKNIISVIKYSCST
jgi:hypothetical protein